MNIKPYSLVLYEAIEWWMAFYKNEILYNTKDPLTREEAIDALENLVETISNGFNRKYDLVREDLIYIIENNIIPDLIYHDEN